jgi:hypothetical protein
MSKHILTRKEEKDILFHLREIAKMWRYDILDDTPIDGADFLDAMGPVLDILKTELED